MVYLPLCAMLTGSKVRWSSAKRRTIQINFSVWTNVGGRIRSLRKNSKACSMRGTARSLSNA